ncbi:hypothetical protein V6N13_025661 [Hibiscus sabdariffa]
MRAGRLAVWVMCFRRWGFGNGKQEWVDGPPVMKMVKRGGCWKLGVEGAETRLFNQVISMNCVLWIRRVHLARKNKESTHSVKVGEPMVLTVCTMGASMGIGCKL